MSNNTNLNPTVTTQMLIRRPVDEVFQAFIDPAITTKFWFTKSTGKLEPGKSITWHWEMYNVSANLTVKEIHPNQRILIEWDNPPCPVEWHFESRPDQSTLVKISNWGFQGTDPEKLAQALDAQGGFSFVLAGLKAYLEHSIELNLVADHFPQSTPEE